MSKLVLKSKQQPIKVGAHKGEDMYVMKVDHYSTMSAEDVLVYASQISGIQEGHLKPAWGAIGDALLYFALQGHIVEIPGLGNIRAEIHAHARKLPSEVSTKDVYRRKFLLMPNKKLKKQLDSARLEITCYDKTGREVKRVKDSDEEKKE